ncbi:MAG TPA: hypothetical protein VE866_10445, partial [Candidatus Binatia bacterium]|nr:hypothetical protein [Candidatus Binatia bacterium]
MRIISNGSTFAGQNPAAVEALLRALETATLDPDFEANGQTFVRRMRVGDNYRVFGNFLDLSHVFQIVGTLEEIRPIALAIRKHRRSERYREAW